MLIHLTIYFLIPRKHIYEPTSRLVIACFLFGKAILDPCWDHRGLFCAISGLTRATLAYRKSSLGLSWAFRGAVRPVRSYKEQEASQGPGRRPQGPERQHEVRSDLQHFMTAYKN